MDAVEKGVFIPSDPGAPGSPCSWCDYNDGTCKYVRRGGAPSAQQELSLDGMKRYIDLGNKKEKAL
jgi:hypothetical protein